MLKYFALITLAITLTSFVWSNGPKGRFKYYGWSGRHGHHRVIKIRFGRVKNISWTDNFFQPTEMKVSGRMKSEPDSIVFIPTKIKFYRMYNKNTGARDEKVKCTCDEKGLKAIDKDDEWYIIKACQPLRYYLHSDTLVEAKTKFKYIRQ